MGTCSSWRPRASDTSRSTGTTTNIRTNAPAMPTVMGKPRATRMANDSRGDPGGALLATTSPTEIGTATASAIQTIRSTSAGMCLE